MSDAQSDPLTTYPVQQRRTDLSAPARAAADQHDGDLVGFLSKSIDSKGNIKSLSNINDFLEWTDIAYAAANFYTDGMAWTLAPKAIEEHHYRLIRNSLRLHTRINGSSNLAGGTNYIYIVIPDGWIADESFEQLFLYRPDTGVDLIMIAFIVKGENRVTLRRFSTLAWDPTTTQVINLEIEFQVRKP